MIKKLSLAVLLAALMAVALIAQTRGAIGRLLGATDTLGNLMVRMDAGSGVAQSRGAIGSLFGRVDTAGNLYVTQDPTVPAVMGNPALFAEGTLAAPSIAFAADPAKGIYSCGVNCMGLNYAGSELFRFSTSGFAIKSDVVGMRIGVNGDAFIGRTGSGIIVLGNANPPTDFTRLQFGGTTASFPALGKAGGTLYATAADNSAYTAMGASFFNHAASTVLTIATNVITPTNGIHHLGAGLVKTITVPATCTATCSIMIIPDAAFTTDATGNISIASTAVIGRVMIFAWDGTKWNPSY